MTYYTEPSAVTGYALDADESFWEVCIPHATRNIIANPSFESGAAPSIGTVIYTDAMLGIASASSVFASNLYRVRVSFTTEQAGTHTLSAYVKLGQAQANRDFNIQLRDAGLNVLSARSVVVRGNGQWVRLVLTSTNPLLASTAYFMEVTSAVQFVADCFQVEALPYATTYVDGDLGIYIPEAFNSYYWDGLSNASTSVRLDNTRTGGKLVSLDQYGFRTLSISGLGHVPIERTIERSVSGRNRSGNFAVSQRDITITGNIYGTTMEELNRKRKNIIDLFSPLKLGNLDDPILLRVHLNETEVPLELMIRYSDGLESEITNNHQQSLQIRVSAIENPYLSGNYNSKSFPLLQKRDNAQALVKNLETGAWTPYNYQLQTGVGFYRGEINDLFLAPNGDLYACGSMTYLVHKLKTAAEGESFVTPSTTYVGQSTSRLFFSTAAGTTLISTLNSGSTLATAVTPTDTYIEVVAQAFVSGDRVSLQKGTQIEYMSINDNGNLVAGKWRYTVTRNLDLSGADSWDIGDVVAVNKIRVASNKFVRGDLVYLDGVTSWETMQILDNATTVTGGFEYTVKRNLDGSDLNIWSSGAAIHNGNGAEYMDATYINNVLYIAVAGKLRVGSTNCSVAIWNSSTNTWSPVLTPSSTDPFVNGNVYSIRFYRSFLYIGGQFNFTISSVTYRALALYEILAQTWTRPIAFSNNNDRVTALYFHTDMKLYIFGEWTSVFTGNSNRFISYDISNGTIVSVLPSLVSPASGGPMHPYSATEILFDKNNRVFLLEWLGQSAHALHSPGKEAPSISGALITDSGYSDWSYNYFAIQNALGNQAISSISNDIDNNLYLGGPINYIDFVNVSNYPAFTNRVLSKVWNRSGSLSISPLDAYHQSISLLERMYYPTSVNQKSIAVATNMEGNNLYYAVPLEVNNTGSVSVSATLQISARCRFIGFWNWTTKEQIVLREPVNLINSGQRIVIYQEDDQFLYYLVSDSFTSTTLMYSPPRPLPINPSGTTSNALMLRPGMNYITLFYQKTSDVIDPQFNPQIIWRNQHGYM